MESQQRNVTANGITQAVRVAGPVDGVPVLLVHGNCSSAAFWEPLVRRLPPTLRVVAPDLRGYGATQTAPVDATRGLTDFADDVAALLDEPSLFADGARPVVVGRSGDANAGGPPRPDRRAAARGTGVPVRLRRHPRPGRHADHARPRWLRRRHGER
ncbi:alpha/beta fold hydrolase [Verrucosispora sioxanthis]|uniref:alpha/beta fold hydrolase n=1 Tax=Verrucosispora sioxanthis TaxID=2499994 RepID=UPI00359F98BD